MVRLSFGGGSFTGPDVLEANVMEQLAACERRLGVVPEYLTAAGRLAFLLEALHRQTGKRGAVLVDEYDKPILDVLEEHEVARANRDYLRGLYGVIKDNDAHVRFTFLTGISKFSKANLFSQLNNLTDITLDPAYSSILRVYGRRPGRGVCARARRGRPGAGAGVVQRLIAGWARRRCTTPAMCCCSCAAASSPRIGSRLVHRRSWWTSCSNAASRRCHSTKCSVPRICCRRST